LSVFEGAAILKGWLANDVMSGVTYRSDGHLADPLQSRTFTSYLKVYLAFLLLTSSFNFSTAEHLIGCLLSDDLCDQNETCYDDFAFGRCLSSSDYQNEDFLYQYPTYTSRAESLLEEELKRLHNAGYVWTDGYTQCIMQTALAAIKYQIEYDPGLCNAIDDEEVEPTDDDDYQNYQDNNAKDDERTIEVAPEEYLIITDPILYDSDNNLNDKDAEQYYYQPDSQELPEETDDDEDTNAYFDIAKKRNLPELLDVSTRDIERPMELPGLENLPLQRTKFYQRPTFSDIQLDYDVPSDYGNQDEEDEDYDNSDEVMGYDDDENSGGQTEQELEFIHPEADYSMLFNRRQRIDVKKPGPFFEASHNNFYLDKITDDDDKSETSKDDSETNKSEDKDVKSTDPGQQEYEIPMSTSMEKRLEPTLLEPNVAETEPEVSGNNYVHIALNNKFQHWLDGDDLINSLAQGLGLSPDTLNDRTIEDQHVQFKVEPNNLDIDAAQIAKTLENDINIQKRLTDNLGVDISKVAAGDKHDRASVFPHGRDLNLLILVVVGASATASLLVGGLIFILAKRSRASKKISKLQLSDDAEDRGKLQEEYKQLCRDWSKTSQSASMENVKNKPTTSVSKLQTQESNGSNGSNRSSTSSWTDEPANNSMDISTGHMVLAYMEDHLKNKQRLEQEWVGLCGYEAEPSSTTVAFKAENKKKNRYPDKLPYDHNRVILNALVNATNSDYINASTVTDHDPRNPSYIVTQGPLGQTVSDFWQMVWEQGCVVIVMLTRLQDNGYQLCTRYWPEEGSEQYHIFEVHLVSEHIWCDDYLVRSFYLKNTRTGETRTVTQFHFQSWPAHGVPSSTKALLEFRRKVNKSYRGRACPIVVHCSDGVGRSGTYALIDMVLNRLSKGCKEIDIAATLEHIRDQRGGMVQNRQQFEFCLMAVAEEVHAILKALPQ